MAEIIVAGHICLDIIPEFLSDADLAPGRLIEVGAAALSTGGCVPNVGRALHRLGVSVRLLGKVGTDPFGEVIQSLLRAESPALADGLIVSPNGTTSYSIVINPPGRDRTFLHMPGENDTFTAADLDVPPDPSLRHLHLGYPPLMAQLFSREGEELEALVRSARDANLTVSLDLSLPDPNSASGRAPWRKILQRVLPYVDHFFPSDTELAFMLQRSPDETDAMIDECLALGANAVILKRGDLGLVAGTRSSNERITHPCFAVDAVGTTGAGDATIAGFLMGYLRGFSFADCLRAGCAVGATSVEAMDAVTAITPWPVTEARIAAGWPLR